MRSISMKMIKGAQLVVSGPEDLVGCEVIGADPRTTAAKPVNR
jgi:hypothetical protein